MQREAGSSGAPYQASQNNASSPSEGDKKPEEESSTWTRVMGGVKMVGGAAETAVGSGLVAVGAATSEFGVGIPIAAAGGLVAVHGADTTISGFRTMVNGKDVDSFTSQGLQGLGMGRTAANLTDTGIGIVGSLGSSAALRTPAVASALTKAAQSETSVTLAFKAAKPIGHNIVGVNTGAGTRWSHLAVNNAERSQGFVTTAEAVIEPLPKILRGFAEVKVPVSAESAAKASQQAVRSLGVATAPYDYFTNDCATYARSILREAGVWTLPITSPGLNYLTTAAQSPQILNAIRPTLSTLGLTAAGINSGVTAKEAINK